MSYKWLWDGLLQARVHHSYTFKWKVHHADELGLLHQGISSYSAE